MIRIMAAATASETGDSSAVETTTYTICRRCKKKEKTRLRKKKKERVPTRRTAKTLQEVCCKQKFKLQQSIQHPANHVKVIGQSRLSLKESAQTLFNFFFLLQILEQRGFRKVAASDSPRLSSDRWAKKKKKQIRIMKTKVFIKKLGSNKTREGSAGLGNAST